MRGSRIFRRKHGLDDAAERNPRNLISLADYQFWSFLKKHLSTAIYGTSPSTAVPAVDKTASDKIYYSNNSVWEAIILDKIRRSDISIILDGFFLFEWFPRSPGLFYTPDGRYARAEAQKNIESIEDGIIVYNPYGKASMLDGGIGAIRLKPIRIDDENYYFMSASSNGFPHEGFPVALPTDLYNQYIDEITDRGTTVRRLVGKLQFIPDDLTRLYQGYTEVPQFYLRIEEIIKPETPKSRRMEELRVSVAVSFLSDYEGHSKIYASYVYFDPSNKNSFRENIEWMEHDYINKKYRGKVITDFDQQKSHFVNAPFSLEKVMNLRLDLAEISSISKKLGIDGDQILQHQAQIQVEVYMDSKYKNVGGNVGAFGDNAQAHDFTQVSNQSTGPLDLVALSEQLSLLKTKLKEEARKEEEAGRDTSQYDIAIGSITAAKTAADKGEEKGVLQQLASAGKWVADFASKVGASLISEVIKKQIGL